MEVAQDRAGDAMYNSGILYVDLPFVVKPLKEYTLQELGTYLHEYVHFLQNLTTPWGLYESCRLYQRISFALKQIQEEQDEIVYLPLEEVYLKECESIERILTLGRGQDKARCEFGGSGLIPVYQLRFAAQTDFKIEKSEVNVEGTVVPEVKLSFNTERHGRSTVLFGAWAIKESMAAMIQKKLDPTSADRHADIPYTLVQRLAKDCFPNIAPDENKLIALCYGSLFSLSPALCFIEMAQYADEHPAESWEGVLRMFKKRGITCGKRKLTVEGFYRVLSTKFLTVVSKLLQGLDLKYIPEMIRATQFGSSEIPLLYFVRDDITLNVVEEVHRMAGEPVVIGTESPGSFPYLERDENTVQEIIYLIGINTLFRFLTTVPPRCPLYEKCDGIGKDVSRCGNTPWAREDSCPLKEVAYLVGIENLHVIKR